VTSNGANAEQIEYWNSDEARHWIDHQARYDAMLRPFTDHLLTVAAIGPGDRVLDVGCGTGTTTFAAAAAARGGDALGLDVSRPMIDRARSRASDEAIQNVRFEVADAQVADVGRGSRDVVMSRFGVMFFDDPVAAFANLAGAAEPGGRLVFVCWQGLPQNEWVLVPGMAAATQIPLPDLGPPGAPGPFALADPDRTAEVLRAAGFRDVDVGPVEAAMLLGGGGSLEETLEFLRGTGMARAIFADAAADAEARATDEVRDALAGHQTPEGVCLGAAAWIVRASR
jgi:SAM-dependent methyltransferase